jgi:hypothetical protein
VTRTEALKVLRLSANADGHAIEQAYWSLVRRAQASQESASQHEIDRLNEAYALLAPEPEAMARTAVRESAAGREAIATARASKATPNDVVFPGDAAFDWIGAEAGRVRRRWSGRNLEIAMISGAGLVLVVLALMGGAAVVPVLICLAVIVAGLWCPWRGSGLPSDRPKEPTK